jgi:hypothetical protein
MKSHGLDCSRSGSGQLVGACDLNNAPLDSINYGEFRAWLRTCYLLKNYSALV